MRHRQFLRCQCMKQSREISSLQPTAKDSGSDNNGNRYLPQRASNPLGKVFCSLLFRHRRSDTVVAIISLYSLAVFNLKLLVCRSPSVKTASRDFAYNLPLRANSKNKSGTHWCVLELLAAGVTRRQRRNLHR